MASVERLLQEKGVFSPDEIESKRMVVSEFCHLLEKSKQLFNGLRDLPQYGHKQWQTYFGRTFDVYTKLWKFQRLHRAVLDEMYGLTRWQIGEIASKIGQLYYHFYLRTSDTEYLMEASSFFTAIRERKYFAHISKENRSEQAVKKLRYYARFIIVCLLLKRVSAVRDLIKELSNQINNYTESFDLVEHTEWKNVVQEIEDFIDADDVCTVLSGDSTPVVITNRLTQFNCPGFEKSIAHSGGIKPLQLSEIIIIGNCFEQIRFSEITLDMFRILQCVERDPQDNFGNTTVGLRPQRSLENGDDCDAPVTGVVAPGERKCKNPHKYLLYKPTFSQFNCYMAAGFKDLPADGVLLLYLSADGLRSVSKPQNDHLRGSGYEVGGVVTNAQRESTSVVKSRFKGHAREPHCIHPGDLYAYTRKPLFLIIDSDNSSAFKNFQSLFGQPLVALLSPDTLPTIFDNERRKGNLFTLFLHCPLTAYLHVCGLKSISLKTWERAQALVDSFMGECFRILFRARHLDPGMHQFLFVDFLRVFVLRFCFCSMVFRLHRDFHDYPICQPPLPTAELMESSLLQKILSDLAVLVDSQNLFASAIISSPSTPLWGCTDGTLLKTTSPATGKRRLRCLLGRGGGGGPHST
ncbi:conserved hypothetical protein [Echinococcus multilocularis]|uniref:Protein SCAI n=1 Tax=Echinococcus multilocularis TaxID=6211 RepID=A0A068YEF6_ECHMU|nr:conserved hypothetical protein [Echinococcus multilocularis]